MMWDNFSILRTNCAILMTYIRADGFSQGEKRPGSRGSRVDVVTLRDQMVCDQMRSKCLLRTDVTLSELFRGGET